MHPYECTHTHTQGATHTHVHEPWRRGYRQALSLEESLRSSNDNERGGVRGGRCWRGWLSSCLQVSLWCWRGQLTSTHNPDTIDTQYKLRVTGPDNLRFTPVAGVGRCAEPGLNQVSDIYRAEQLLPNTGKIQQYISLTTETTHHKFWIVAVVKRKWKNGKSNVHVSKWDLAGDQLTLNTTLLWQNVDTVAWWKWKRVRNVVLWSVSLLLDADPLSL